MATEGDSYCEKIDSVISKYSNHGANCNRILSLFLIFISKYVTEAFYKEMVVFICLYRKVLNEKGWEKLKENNLCDSENVHDEYCEVKDAEYAPDSSNIFMIDYFPQYIQNKSMLNTGDLIF